MTKLTVGDKVYLRGDRRTSGRYSGNQLVEGRYVKHAVTGKAWIGMIKQIHGDMALCGGGWRGIEMYEKV